MVERRTMEWARSLTPEEAQAFLDTPIDVVDAGPDLSKRGRRYRNVRLAEALPSFCVMKEVKRRANMVEKKP